MNDSANEMDTITRKDTDYKTQLESDFKPVRKQSKKGTVAFTEKRSRKRGTVLDGNNIRQFENTSVEMMPSVVKTPAVRKEIKRNRQNT